MQNTLLRLLTSCVLVAQAMPIYALDVDKALDAASKPKAEASSTVVESSANATKGEVDRRVGAILDERDRKRREFWSAGVTRPTVEGPAAWVITKRHAKDGWWNEGGFDMKCTGGRKAGDAFTAYVDRQGVWSSPGVVVGSDETPDHLARRVCE